MANNLHFFFLWDCFHGSEKRTLVKFSPLSYVSKFVQTHAGCHDRLSHVIVQADKKRGQSQGLGRRYQQTLLAEPRHEEQP